MHLHQKAPEFSLEDQSGTTHTLASYLGKWVVLYFYPKDGTPGCTTEACAFRDAFTQLQKHNVVILGVSKDSVESHKAFAKEHTLNFPLLADTEADVSKDYGAWHPQQFNGQPGIKRETFLIDPDGDVAKIYKDVDPLVHAKEIMKDLEELNNEL